MKSSITFSALFLKGFLVNHEFFSIPCCTFELNLKCIFDKLELLFLFPLHENIVALLNWKYFWQIGTPFSWFLLHENFVSKGKEQKKITGSEYEIRRKKRIRILVHILTFIAQCLPISQKKSIDLRNLKCFQSYVNEIKKIVFCFRNFLELKREKNVRVIEKTFFKFESNVLGFSSENIFGMCRIDEFLNILANYSYFFSN